MKNKLLLVATLLAMGFSTFAAEEEYRLPRLAQSLMKTIPTIDGEIKPGEWKDAARMEGLCRHTSGTLIGQKISFWIGADNKKLYIAAICETAPGGEILAKAIPSKTGNAKAYIDDSLEFYFHTNPADKFVYQSIINSRGAIYTNKCEIGGGGGEGWRGEWEVANKIIDNTWHFEGTIPLENIGLSGSIIDKQLSIRVCRSYHNSSEELFSQWDPKSGPFVNVATMPKVTFIADAPIVQILELFNYMGKANLKVSISNPTAKPLMAKLNLSLSPNNSAHSQLEETANFSSDETKIFELKSAALDRETIRTLIKVTSPDDSKTYYLRDFSYETTRKEPLFVKTEDTSRTGFEFAFYPSLNIMKIRLDFNGLITKDKITSAKLEIRKKGETSPIATTEIKQFKNYSAKIDKWQLPVLDDGEYEITMTTAGITGKPVTQTFFRNKFEWEGNKIGMSDILIPPFTAIKVEEDTVSTILRKHTLDKLGLWTQVEALDSKILQNPMRLEAIIAGKTYIAEGAGLTWTEKGDTKATATAKWQAGPISGSVNVVWDYDGLMLWKLILDKTTVKIDSLRLVVPVSNEIAPLMHECTDGIRFNYAGFVPKGEGVVWNSKKAARSTLGGNIVPYLWVGGEELGISVSCENDKGWLNAPNKDCQEIIRHGNTLDLVYNLISAPSVIDSGREIKLAFQASPVKPMPEGWRLKIFGNWKAADLVKKENYRVFLGACYYWGTETAYREYYPRNKDFNYMKKLAEARKTGMIDEAYKTEWLKGYGKMISLCSDANQKKDLEDLYKNHINAAFSNVARGGQLSPIIIYTNGRGVRFDLPEGRTFMNEWTVSEFLQRNWPYAGGMDYEVDANPSFRDFAVYYFKKMADILVDSVYWDNFFLVSSYDTALTDAYYQADGTIQPSTGFFNLREYARRTAVMYTEMGRQPMNMVHMSTTAINPILSFAQLNYTWEDKLGDLDFQDRFSRDYIRAESIGRQQGNIPYCLWLVNGNDPKKLAWADRTGAGVALTHEIKTSSGDADAFASVYKKLVKFGYGTPEVTVLNYWKKDYPVKVEGIDTSSLTLIKPGSCLILIADWGNGGDALITPPPNHFKNSTQIKAKDLDNNKPLEVTPDRKIKFNIKKHDYKVVLIEEGN